MSYTADDKKAEPAIGVVCDLVRCESMALDNVLWTFFEFCGRDKGL